MCDNLTSCLSGSNDQLEESNLTDIVLSDPEFEHPLLLTLLAFFSVVTVGGNLLVIGAVLREQTLHTATNYFITSLAVSDCLVGLIVMPFSAAYEAMSQKWIFGPDWCDIWHSFDVLGSTASILNLCVISLDRYWAITDPMTYPAKMTDTKAGLLILLVWICSSAISFPAIAWWRLTATGPPPAWQCHFTEDIGYLVFSSTVSFYGPLTIMVFTYVRVYKAAVEHTKSLRIGAKQLTNSNVGNGVVTLRMHRGGGNHCAAREIQPRTLDSGSTTVKLKGMVVSQNFNFSRKLAKFAKEKKAAKTLGTVMGIFIICWFPFFLVNVISGLLTHVVVPEIVFQIVTWLGWLNSSMNPFIYASCSRDFRRAFTRIICCQFGRRKSSLKSLSWQRVSSERNCKSHSYSLPCLAKTNGSAKSSNTFETTNYFSSEMDRHLTKHTRVTNTNHNIENSKKVPEDSGNSLSDSSPPEILFSYKMKAKVLRRSDTQEMMRPNTQVDLQRNLVVFHRQITKCTLYEIPPPNYNRDPMLCREKLL